MGEKAELTFVSSVGLGPSITHRNHLEGMAVTFFTFNTTTFSQTLLCFLKFQEEKSGRLVCSFIWHSDPDAQGWEVSGGEGWHEEEARQPARTARRDSQAIREAP